MAARLGQRVVRDAVLLVSRSLFGRAIGYPVALVTARALGPEVFGLLQLVNFIPGFAKYGGLGSGSFSYWS
jgi:O-antigen/teichoic acid export membrane protein